jgi:hypothetical protein
LTTSLSEVTWLWLKTRETLISAWIDTLEKLKQTKKEELLIIVKSPVARTQLFTFLKI